jgi:hypothetical protein
LLEESDRGSITKGTLELGMIISTFLGTQKKKTIKKSGQIEEEHLR